MATQPQKPLAPTCKAILICDTTIVEAVTGKVSLVGTFGRFGARAFPATLKPFHAFVQLTNCTGRYDIKVEIHDLRDDVVISRGSGVTIDVADRHQATNVVLPVPSLRVDHDGRFDLVVFANGDEIDRQSFDVLEVPNANH